MSALFLLLLFAPCLWAAPQSNTAAVARLNEDIKALEMALEQKEQKKKKQPFDGTWDPIGMLDRWGSDHYFSGFPEAHEWDRLRKLAAAVYDKGTNGRCNSHPGLGAGDCIEILACDTSDCNTATGNKNMVPYKVFKTQPFGFADGVDCVVSFKGTNPAHASDLITDGVEVGSTGRSGYFKTERIKKAVVHLFNQDSLSSKCKSIIATGHSLGGCTAHNAAVYGGVRAFTFAGPGPSRGGANKVHSMAQMAVEGSATLYTGPDTIPFAGKHIGDYVCDRAGSADGRAVEVWNERGAGREAISSAGLAGHSAVISEPINDGDTCFSTDSRGGYKSSLERTSMSIGNARGEFSQIGQSFAERDVWGQFYFGQNGEDVEWSTVAK